MTRKKIFPETINGKKVRVTYEGCDVIKLDAPPSPNKLHTLLIASNVTYIRVGENKLFYANKAKNKLVELKRTRSQIKSFDDDINLKNLQLNESKPLTEKNLEHLTLTIDHKAPGSEKVRNVEFALIPQEREEVLRKLYDKRINAKNSSYTYMFQGFLAKYQGKAIHEIDKLIDERAQEADKVKQDKLNEQITAIKTTQGWMNDLHALSTEFINFEHFINNPKHNNPGADPEKSLEDLLQAVQQYELNIKTKIQNILNNLNNKKYNNLPEITAQLTGLTIKLDIGIQLFKNKIETLQTKRATKDQIQQLLSIHTRDLTITSLGTFMADQMIDVLASGIKVAYEISDSRFYDLFDLPIAIGALSDAKKMIYLKSQTLDGAEYNDTYSPIPEDMLSALTGDPQININNQDEKSWFSIKPYLSDWNPTDLDEVICLITDTPFHRKTTAKAYIALSGFGASILELALIAPIRLAVLIICTALDLVESILRPFLSPILDPIWNALLGNPFFAKNPDEKITNQIDKFLSNLHERISPVLAAKKWWSSRYLRDKNNDSSTEKEKKSTITHQKLIDECMESSNFYHSIFEYLSPQRMADYIRTIVGGILLSPIKLIQDLNYAFSPLETEEVYRMVSTRHQLTQYCRKNLEEEYKAFENRRIKLEQADTIDEEKTLNNLKQYPMLHYCHINEISSPLEVFREIMLTLDDSIIDPMFRKSPGFATFYFIISATTFGTYLAPASALAMFKSFPAFLKMPTDIISIHFTGKATSLGIQEQMVACFLEWKLGFFTTEFIMETKRGNFNFLNDLVREPEQLTMGLIGLIGLGLSLQYIPLLPTTITIPPIAGLPPIPPIYNFYAEIVNVFIDESVGCKSGTIGLTSLEYGFLGLKFAMLMHSMLSGARQGEHADALQQLSKACSTEQFLKDLINTCKTDKEYLTKNATDRVDYFKTNILKPALDQILTHKKLTNHFTETQLEEFKNALASQIPLAMKEYSKYKKQSPDERADEQNAIKGIHPEQRMLEILQADCTIHLNPVPTDLAEIHNNHYFFDNNQLFHIQNGKKQALEINNLPYFTALITSMKRNKDESITLKFQQLNDLQNYKSPLEKAHDKLQEAIKMVNDKKNPLVFASDASQVFSRTKEANKFYDHLDKLFNDYNLELQKSENADLCINKHDFLDVFYNKYCYQSSNNLMRFLLFFPPFYAVTVLVRETKRLLAWARNRPSMMHQVIKSYNKDMVILLQIAAITARTYYAMARALSYSFRAFFILITVPPIFIIASPYLLYSNQFKAWYKAIDRIACYMALHHSPPLNPIRTLYSNVARIAGINDDVSTAGDNIIDQLSSANKLVLNHLPSTHRNDLTHVIECNNAASILARHDKAAKTEKKQSIPNSNTTSVTKAAPLSKIKIGEELNTQWGQSAAQVRKMIGKKTSEHNTDKDPKAAG
ncbi:hypothetical protein N9Q05_01455 [bacterium]|nr:hypothetical protein [bacterium]